MRTQRCLDGDGTMTPILPVVVSQETDVENAATRRVSKIWSCVYRNMFSSAPRGLFLATFFPTQFRGRKSVTSLMIVLGLGGKKTFMSWDDLWIFYNKDTCLQRAKINAN